MARVVRTKDECAAVAAQFKTRAEFQRGSKAFYLYAFRRKWLDDICSHMVTVGSRKLRFVYVIQKDVSVYVGLTYNISSRQSAHRSNPRIVDIFGPDLTLVPISNLLPVEEAARIEIATVKTYRDAGYHVVNKIKAGGVGGTEIKWTDVSLRELASNYKTMAHFRSENESAYQAAFRHGHLDILSKILVRRKTKNGTWTKENCATEASRYKERGDFRKLSSGAYDAACTNGWLAEITAHMMRRSKNVRKRDLFSPIPQRALAMHAHRY